MNKSIKLWELYVGALRLTFFEGGIAPLISIPPTDDY